MTAAMLCHAKAWKFKRTVSQNEAPFRSENLCKFHFLTALVLHESKNLKESIAKYVYKTRPALVA